MILSRLRLRNFRNLRKLDQEFAPGLSLLWGGNGAGKTNLLEAILLACRGESPRAQLDEHLISWESDHAQVAAELRRADRELRVEVMLGRQEGKRFRVNGLPKRRGEVPVGGAVYFCATDLEIVQGDPSVRRRFLDEELGWMSRSYYWNLHHYRRALAQRNRLLREAAGAAPAQGLDTWADQLVRFGAQLVHSRLAFLRELEARARVAHAAVAQENPALALSYQFSEGGLPSPDRARAEEPRAGKGEPESEEALGRELRAALLARRGEELRRGMTLAGPHRDDFSLTLEDRPARLFASQGEQRTLALALRLGLAEMIEGREGEPPLLLLDDVFSELDPARRARLLSALGSPGAASQAFITLCDPSEAPEVAASGAVVLKVEGGKVG
jgi:DNA replication and repair protein RecF